MDKKLLDELIGYLKEHDLLLDRHIEEGTHYSFDQELNKKLLGFGRIWADILGIGKEAHKNFLALKKEHNELKKEYENLIKQYNENH